MGSLSIKRRISDFEPLSKEEAKKIVLEKFPNIEIGKIIDYQDMYVFDMKHALMDFVVVRKTDGAIDGMNPMMLNNPDEFFKVLQDTSNNSNELAHHGVKGMKWGRRKQRATENQAARAHFKSERTGNFQQYRKATNKKNLKEGKLTTNQIKSGRYRVAKARSIKRNAASVAIGTLTGVGAAAAIAGTGGLATPVILAGIGTAGVGTIGAHFGTGAHYYGKQRKSYKKGVEATNKKG